VTGIKEVTSLTLRIFGPRDTLEAFVAEPAVCVPGGEDTNDNGEIDPGETPDCSSPLYTGLGYALSAQSANTEFCREGVPVEQCQINKGQELIIKDVIPPSFDPELVDGTEYLYEATGSDPDAAAYIDLVAKLGLTAYDNCDPLTPGDCSEENTFDVTCEINGTDSASIEGGIPVALGSNPATCFTEADAQGNVNTWNGFVFIADNVAPVLTIPATKLIVAPTSAAGASVDFLAGGVWDLTDSNVKITVSDNIFREDPPYDYPQLSCDKQSPSTFGFDPTTVTCTVVDAGPCSPTGVGSCFEDAASPNGSWNVKTESFTVTVQDSDAPVITCIDDEGLECDVLPPIEKQATGVETPVTLTAPLATDPDDIDPNPSVAAYTDASCVTPAPTEFPLGTTEITWCATDFAGNTSTIQQSITIVDTTPPGVTVEFVDGDQQFTDIQDGKNVDFTVDVDDIFPDPDPTSISCETSPGVPVESGDLFQLGSTTVTCYALDTSENEGVGSATVDIKFVYAESPISGKQSGKTGSSFPLEWAWLDGLGTKLTVSSQELLIERGTCSVTVGVAALDPGSSGLRQDADGTYLYNYQAIDPETQEPWVISQNKGDPFCFRVALPTGETKEIDLTIRP
jgi:hypothetical protein